MKLNRSQLRKLINEVLVKEGMFSDIGSGIGRMFGFGGKEPNKETMVDPYIFVANIPLIAMRGSDPSYNRNHALNRLRPDEKIAKARRFAELLNAKPDLINIKFNSNRPAQMHQLPVFTKVTLDQTGTNLLLYTDENQLGFDKFGISYLKDISQSGTPRLPLVTGAAAPWQYEALMRDLGVQDPDVAQLGEAMLRVLRFASNKKLRNWRPSYM